MMPKFPNYAFIDDQSLRRIEVSNVVRSEMDAGPEKTRPKLSVPMFQIAMDISICVSKLNDFRAWKRNEIGSGAYWFLLNDPYDGTERRFRFFQHDGEWIKIGEDVLKTSIVLEAYDEL